MRWLAATLAAGAALTLASAAAARQNHGESSTDTAAAAATVANKSFADASGDSDTAPDLTSVEVSDTGGLVVFKIAGALVPDSAFEILIDVDRNRATGDGGKELWLSIFQESDGKAYWDADRWNGSKWDDFGKLGVVSQTFPGREELGFPAADAGLTGPFDFVVLSFKMVADAVESRDRAPDSIVPYTYELAATRTAKLVLGQVRVTPARAIAGKTLTVSVPVGPAAAGSGTAQCTASVGSRTITGRGTAAGGRATCRLLVPRGSSGKTGRGKIVVSTGGTSAAKSFSFRIA